MRARRLTTDGRALASPLALQRLADRRGECLGANFNTGVLYLRGTAAARELVSVWAQRMESVGPEPWLDDQAVLNDLVREGLVKEPAAGGVASARYEVDQPTGGAGTVVALTGSRTYRAARGIAIVGILPLAEIANGHTFFVQHVSAAASASHCHHLQP